MTLLFVFPETPGAPSIDQLINACPRQFMRLDNPWGTLAARVCRNEGASVSEWMWKSADREVRTRQMVYLTHIMALSRRRQEFERHGLVAWILSEMLREAPRYVPPKFGEPKWLD